MCPGIDRAPILCPVHVSIGEVLRMAKGKKDSKDKGKKGK
jgi:hypothetical protein